MEAKWRSERNNKRITEAAVRKQDANIDHYVNDIFEFLNKTPSEASFNASSPTSPVPKTTAFDVSVDVLKHTTTDLVTYYELFEEFGSRDDCTFSTHS
jgi:hypothetical protein